MTPKKTFLFVKYKDKDEVAAIYEIEEQLFQSEKQLLDAVVRERDSLETLFPEGKFSITQVSGEDLYLLVRIFPELLGKSSLAEVKAKEQIIRIDFSKYVRYRSSFYIAPDENDRVVMETEIEGGTIPMSRLKRGLGVTPGGAAERSYENLRLEASTDPGCDIKVSLLGVTDNKFNVMILLWPPVQKSDRRSFRLSHVWKDMWAPLREKGRDEGRVKITTHVETFEIRVIPPKGTSLQMIPRQSLGIIVEERDEDVKAYVWKVSNAPPGAYEFEVYKRG